MAAALLEYPSLAGELALQGIDATPQALHEIAARVVVKLAAVALLERANRRFQPF